ncbi:hypothetical protein QJS04_geneDACA013345 [Acorus gramineus]|uniref:RNase H type-1 domain-containing protein n=1 Tax=Acorus gramineus TaxID=55184 RepID=A0AAV9A7T8_ACOGR|nr:hypothetical protein QJS04_geneDACA013345 [Acorus gramineus]
MSICANELSGKALKGRLVPRNSEIGAAWGIAIKTLEKVETAVSWCPPEVGWTKANSDGSLLADRAGFGVVLRNEAGELLLAVAIQEKVLSSINVLEFHAILHGLKMALSLGVPRVHIESDSATAIAWVQGKGCLPWRCFRDRMEILSLLPTFAAWKISHVPREGNQVADHLAAHCDSPGSSTVSTQ